MKKQSAGPSMQNWLAVNSPAKLQARSNLSSKRANDSRFDDKDDDFKTSRASTSHSTPVQLLQGSIECCLDEKMTFTEEVNFKDENEDPKPRSPNPPPFEQKISKKGLTYFCNIA